MKPSNRQHCTVSPLNVSFSGVEWYEFNNRFVWVKLCEREKPVRIARSKLPVDAMSAYGIADAARAAVES